MKQQRHTAIRELIVRTSVLSQDDLRQKLAERGFHVTQATLSRDIHELRLSKGQQGYYSPAGIDQVEEDADPSIREILRTFGLEARLALHLLVLITTTGSAQTVAAAIDYEDWEEVVGTIAGDDTVLLICAEETKSRTLKERIDSYLG